MLRWCLWYIIGYFSGFVEGGFTFRNGKTHPSWQVACLSRHRSKTHIYILYIYYIYIHNLFSVHSKWLFFDHPKFLNSTRSLDFKNLSSGTSLHRKGTPGFRRPWVSRRFPEGAFGIFFPENKDLIHGKKGFWWFWSMDLTCFNHENWGFINGLDGTQL
jgi:hypothetical protein